jgi:hypothetical protein
MSNSIGFTVAGLGQTRLRRLLLAHCAGTAAAILFASAAAAGCNSGNVGDDDLLSSANCEAQATGVGATAVGAFAKGNGPDATAIGYLTQAVQGAIAIGGGAIANQMYSIAVGNIASATGERATVFGFDASATADTAVALGPDSQARGTSSIAIGLNSIAQGFESVVVGPMTGDHAGAFNTRNSAFGGESGRFVTGSGNTALGLAAGFTVTGDLNSGYGNSAGQFVTGSSNTAGGVLAGRTVKGSYNLAEGPSAGNNVTGSYNLAEGSSAGNNVTGSYNLAEGPSAGKNVTGSANIAIGLNAGTAIAKSNTVAIGSNARAVASSAIAVGTKAVAKFSQSVAIGTNSVTSAVNVVSVGAPGHFRRIMNVANAAAANDAVNLGQVKALIKAASPQIAVAAIAPVASASRNALAAGNLLSHSGRQVTSSATSSAAAVRGRAGTRLASISPARTSTAAVQSAATAAASDEDLEPSTIVGWANVNPDGAVSGSRNIAGHARHSAGSYEIVFKRIASNRCTYNATLAGIGLVSVTAGSLANSLKVETRNHNGVLTDTGFYLMAVC